MSADLLSIRGLCKSFGGLAANSDVTFDVVAGSVHAVIGPNGAGKTTLLSQLAGDLMPDSGAILFDGVEITRFAAARRARAGIGRSFQVTSVMPSLTVRENVTLAALQRAHGPWTSLLRGALASPKITSEVDEILARVGLSARHSDKAIALSHGERRQLEFAITLAARPRLMLLDEPTAGMGRDETQKVVHLIQDLRATQTIMLVEHDMDVVFSVSDTITVMAGGRPIATGAPEEIRSNALVRQAYLGPA